jgi:hypothetical protein
MSEMKPSGIRPPSKIERPTCTVTPKPSLPPRSMSKYKKNNNKNFVKNVLSIYIKVVFTLH